MTKNKQPEHLTYSDADMDEPVCNRSGNRLFQDVVEARIGRRALMRGAMGVAAAGVASPVAGFFAKADAATTTPPKLNFTSVPLSRADRVIVATGYTAKPFIPWGMPLTGEYPAYKDGGLNTGEEQEQQVGMHHDGITFFPMFRGGSDHGLLCINHEYIDPKVLHANGPTTVAGKRTVVDEVRKEVAAHGVSVVEIVRDGNGDWSLQRGRFNRRITAATPMQITGPVRGSNLVKTKYSPDGTRARGTFADCANGDTPWQTYLTCEENWAGYFFNGDANHPREHKRYGVPKVGSRYGWGTIDSVDEYTRFNAGTRANWATGDYRNEPNTCGWVVEIDPFTPKSTPKKRTAMGRFAHESAAMAPPEDGQPVVVYMGDDSTFEYIYKFVSKERYSMRRRNNDLLEDGTLYVARFNDDGSGDWIALTFGENGLTPFNGFTSQADILVNTRAAADHVGATPMDRPEWAAVHPKTGEVYVTLTNNRGRKDVNAANPRPANIHGHIIRWAERGKAAQATAFDWDFFAMGGPQGDNAVFADGASKPLDATNMFSCPDGLWFDNAGVLWIETDGNQFASNDMLLAAVPETGEMRRLMTGVKGCEMTGLTGTPDRKTLFCNIQHPGSNNSSGSQFPDGPGHRPRSATIVVTRDNGGVVGGA